MKYWYQKTISEVEAELHTNKEGLSKESAVSRLERYGKNELPKAKQKNMITLFFQQLLNPLILILVVTGIISIFAHEYMDSIFILVVILMDAILGTFQEWKALKSATALQNMIKIESKVIRDNQITSIPSEELVVGDFLYLESGDKIGADIRFTHTANLTIDESFLTGESIATAKSAKEILKEVPITEQKNIGFAGATVISGRATGIVIATGKNTELGKIAHSVNNSSASKSPLVIRMEKFTKQISLFIMMIAIMITFILYLKGMAPKEIFFTVVALSISAIPEGLPVSLTIALSVASSRMAKKNVIVRKLNAVEGLGSCTVIATDKTGTLTLNEQTAKTIVFPSGKTSTISGIGYNGNGSIINNDEEIKNIVTMGVINNEASLYLDQQDWKFRGDSIDIALLSLGYKAEIDPHIKERLSIIGDIPYESEKKYSAVFYSKENEVHATVKGSLETILPFCKNMMVNGKFETLDSGKIMRQNEELASSGFRVIAFAEGTQNEFQKKENYDAHDIKNLTFLGLIGFIDPIRSEVPNAIKACKEAGVKVIMITGDHPLTAVSIGKELGLGTSVTTGEELQNYLETEDFNSDDFIKNVNIFARVTPSQKLAIVESLKRQGEFVAVTGDGVNDAPAMKAANIGIAMGSGTDVAKETGSLIITDDNFNSIVSGIEEGRYAYDNIRKVIYMLLSCGISEVLFFILSLILGLPIPLLATQLLWLNLVTDGIQDVALAFEKGDKSVMKKRPRKTSESVFNKIMIEEVLLSGIVIGGIVFGFWFYLINIAHMDIVIARSYILLTMVFMQNIHVLNCRSELISSFKLSIKNNPLIIFGIIVTLILQFMVTETTLLSNILKTVPLDIYHIIFAFLLTIPLFAIMEVFKFVKRKE